MHKTSMFVALALLSIGAHAQEDASSFVPAKMNVLYGHPGQISAMVGVAASPGDVGILWLQGDYERFYKPGLSFIGGIQYMDLYPKGDEEGEGDAGFVDVLAGVRWYSNGKFSGFYLQPQLNYNHIFLNVNDDAEEWSLGVDRFGVSGVLGFNGKWDVISVDWNVGFYALNSPSTKIEKKDKRTGVTEEVDVKEEADEIADYILKSVLPTTSFAVGYLF